MESSGAYSRVIKLDVRFSYGDGADVHIQNGIIFMTERNSTISRYCSLFSSRLSRDENNCLTSFFDMGELLGSMDHR
jgi:hypothetical protein